MANVQEVQRALEMLNRQAQAAGGGEQMALRNMAAYANANNISNDVLAQASGFAEGGAWTPEQVAAVRAQYQYGLNPALGALSGAATEATNRIGDTQQRVSGLFKEGLGRLDPYMQTGIQANQLQAALSGTLGADAQRQAYANFQSSPGQQWLQEQGERAVTRNASALGGLGGGNVRQELQRQGIGFAMQDYGNQFNRMGQVADRGFGASSQAASFGPQEAAIQSNLGQFAANIPMQSAALQSQMQFQAGRDVSQNIGNTSSALATLMNQSGAGTADMINGQANNFANLYTAASQGDAQAREQLATLLGNVQMQGAGQYAGQPTTPMTGTNYLGQLGQITGGVGGLLAGIGNQGQPQTGPNTAYNTSPGYGPTYTGAYNPGVYLGGL